MPRRPPELFGILGHPLGHSMSPVMFAAVLPDIAPGSGYSAFDVSPEELPGFMAAAQTVGIRGMSVTIPHKQSILPHMSALSHETAAIGASNCVVLTKDGWHAHNTDAPAFADTLTQRHIQPSSVLVLGSGGAARAVLYALRQLRVQRLALVSRDPGRLAADPFFTDVDLISYDRHLARRAASADLIVNATPLGMAPNEHGLPLDQGFGPDQTVYDLVYNPRPTRFLQVAAKAGATAIDGLEMLARQAAYALFHFTGATVAWQKFLIVARKELTRQEID
jgi:shikimate dehydrogenase